MSANNYGTANPVIYPAYGTMGADVACPSGVETTVLDIGNTFAISPGVYYPLIWLNIWISIGATPPNPCLVAGRLNGGADFQSVGPNPLSLVANANIYQNYVLRGPISPTLWTTTGGDITITVNPTGQAVTVRSYGTYAWLFLMRAPDQ